MMERNEKKYCILGATSFAGRSCVESLLQGGHNLLAIARRELPTAPFSINCVQQKKLKWVKADIVSDTERLILEINKFKPDYIIDFMGQGMVAQSWIFPEQWYITNVAKKSELINGLNWEDYLCKYIRISTPEVFGSVEETITEQHPFNPSTPYALSHATIDQHLKLKNNENGFPYIISRYANFYGPGQQIYRIIPKALFLALSNQKLILEGGGLSERAFIYKDDIISSLQAIIKHGKIGESYHFSDTKCISIKSLVRQIAECCGINYENFTTIGAERKGKDQRYFMSVDKALSSLGWKPKMSLKDGIVKTRHWIADSKEIITPNLLNYTHIF